MENLKDIREKARMLTSAVEIDDFSYWAMGDIAETLAKYFNIGVGEVGYKINEVFFNNKDCLGQLEHFYRVKKNSESFNYSVKDFFDIPTSYHYYKYLQMIASVFNSNFEIANVFKKNSLSIEKTINPVYNNGNPISNIGQLLYIAIEAYENLSNEENMCYRFFSPCINWNEGPVKFKNPREVAFKNVKDHENETISMALGEQGRCVEMVRLNRKRISNLFKSYNSIVKDCESCVFDYMVDFLKKEGFANNILETIKVNKQGKYYLGFSSRARIVYAEKEEKKPGQVEQLTLGDTISENQEEVVEGYGIDEGGQLIMEGFGFKNSRYHGFDN